ncbi:MAG: hypothetical protein ACRDL7_03000 [Gaiellaceae bacterium]
MPGENSNSAVKRIFVGTIVRGSHGDFIEDAGANERKRRRREKVSGHVEAVVGRNVYRVRFEKVGLKEVNSRTVTIVCNAELDRAIVQANNIPTLVNPPVVNAGSPLPSENGNNDEEEEHLPQPGDMQEVDELGELGTLDKEDEENEVVNIGDINASLLCDIHQLFLRRRQTSNNRFAGRLLNHLLKYAKLCQEDGDSASGRVSSVPTAVTTRSSIDKISNDLLICMRMMSMG